MVRPKDLCDSSGVWTFINSRLAFAKTDRECPHAARPDFGHQCDHSTGVDASTQERTKRDLADKVQPNRFLQMMEKTFPIIILRLIVIRHEFEPPVPPQCQFTLVPYRDMAGRQLGDVLIDCSGTGHILEAEKI